MIQSEIVSLSVSPHKRFQVFRLDGYECVYCGETITPKFLCTVDHLLPVSCGGQHVIENMVTACKGCNNRRSNRPLNSKTLRFGRFRSTYQGYGKPSKDLLDKAYRIPKEVQDYLSTQPYCPYCNFRRWIKWRKRWVIWMFYTLIGKGRPDRMKR